MVRWGFRVLGVLAQMPDVGGLQGFDVELSF